MERKNIADILNKSYGVDTSKEGITENDLLKADLSNIVDFGRKIVQGDDVAKKGIFKKNKEMFLYGTKKHSRYIK